MNSGRDRTRRRLWRAVLERGCTAALCALALLLPLQAQQRTELPETEVKAAFLFNFMKFVEWPQTSFSKPTNPIVVCFLGREGLADAFEELAKGKELSGRSILVRRIEADSISGCQVVYLGSGSKRLAHSVIEELRNQPVLTVADIEQFARTGGVINFDRQDRKLRFIINPEAGTRAGLHISSKLLSLATIVHEQAAN